PVPHLDLGKKMSTPQDLMIEELSLRNNRGSQLFQQRQRRMQRFIFEHPSGYKEVGEGDPEGTANEWTVSRWRKLRGAFGSPPSPDQGRGSSLCPLTLPPQAGEEADGQQSYHSELHVAASPQGGPPAVPKKTEKVLQMSKILNPDALAPGYSGPLKEVPPEKFNITAIPKGYRSPWQDLLRDKDNAVHGENQLLMRPSPWDFRSFNRTPTPFDKALLSDLFPVPAVELDNLSVLEVIAHRPNFNRVPQGWVRVLPESDEL
ncbi:MYOZ3 protein, partial [Glaucidium brasilianum]|nr:MYOZ3 protein [Glaucidium brasilianum]